MAQRVIGLDIGTNAVRVAEVELGVRPVLRAFGQVGLPPGACVDGEVVAPAVVGEAIRRLWREVGIKGKIVRVGVASQRVVVRAVDFPDLPDAELESALTFEAQEYIPMPLAQAVLDFQVIESFTGPEGEPLIRVLLAAAHQELVGNTLAAVSAGGLRASAVDLVSFALIRSLAAGGVVSRPSAQPTAAAEDPDASAADEASAAEASAAEAILCVGAGVTTVVVHEAGIPTFVRTTDVGGSEITEALAEELGVELAEAEALKRRVGFDDDEMTLRAARILDARVRDAVSEIRGTLNFYETQPDVAPVERVLFTGGGSLLAGFEDALRSAVRIPLEPANPRLMLDIGNIGFAPEDLPSLDAFLSVPVGLALGGGKAVGRRINLLPLEARIPERSTPLLAGLTAGGVALVVLMAALTMGRSNAISDQEDALAAQQRINQDLQAQVSAVADAGRVEEQANAAREQVTALLAGEVSWSQLLQDVARTIPGDVWLTGFTGNTSTPGAVPEEGAPVGSVSFSAQGINFPSVAAWLLRMSQIPYMDGFWVPSIAQTALGGTVSFDSSVSLRAGVGSSRVDRVLQGDQ